VRPTRDRLVTATGELLRRGGYHGTSMKQITAAAGAPTGSMYHFFPGGKDELVAEVLLTSGEAYRQLFVAIASDAPDAPSAVAAFFDGAAAVLEDTDFVDPCPIGTVAREVANTNEPLRAATARVFASWLDTAVEYLEGEHVASTTARELATTIVAALEGGFILARARRNAEPLRAAGRMMSRLVIDVQLRDRDFAAPSRHALHIEPNRQ
jgi:AcrR family transcriptional regulator